MCTFHIKKSQLLSCFTFFFLIVLDKHSIYNDFLEHTWCKKKLATLTRRNCWSYYICYPGRGYYHFGIFFIPVLSYFLYFQCNFFFGGESSQKTRMIIMKVEKLELWVGPVMMIMMMQSLHATLEKRVKKTCNKNSGMIH